MSFRAHIATRQPKSTATTAVNPALDPPTLAFVDHHGSRIREGMATSILLSKTSQPSTIPVYRKEAKITYVGSPVSLSNRSGTICLQLLPRESAVDGCPVC